MAPEGCSLPPLRSLDDFLLKSARFQIPNFKDLDKWGNRVNNNLLYYQTNYILVGVIIFIVVGLIHPAEMIGGYLATAVVFGMFYYFTNSTPSAERFKKNHPFVSLGIILSGGYFIVHMIGGILVFLLGILLPIFVMFVHASLRLRSIQNKITNMVGPKTPMGLLLDALEDFGDALADEVLDPKFGQPTKQRRGIKTTNSEKKFIH